MFADEELQKKATSNSAEKLEKFRYIEKARQEAVEGVEPDAAGVCGTKSPDNVPDTADSSGGKALVTVSGDGDDSGEKAPACGSQAAPDEMAAPDVVPSDGVNTTGYGTDTEGLLESSQHAPAPPPLEKQNSAASCDNIFDDDGKPMAATVADGVCLTCFNGYSLRL